MLRWREESKVRLFYKVQSEVSFKVSFSDKNRPKQMIIARLRFGKCLLNDTVNLMGIQMVSVTMVWPLILKSKRKM